MPSGCFVDTNILIYARDPGVPEKRARANEWLNALADAGRIVVSPQVMNEFAHNIIRKLPYITRDQLYESLVELRGWCTAPTTAETAIDGLAIHRHFQFSFYDSVLLASATAAGCAVFLSEDLTHEQRVRGITIFNPFLASPGSAI